MFNILKVTKTEISVMEIKICNNDSKNKKKRSIIEKMFVFCIKMFIFLKFNYCFCSIENIKLQIFSITFVQRFSFEKLS